MLKSTGTESHEIVDARHVIEDALQAEAIGHLIGK